MVDNKDYKKDKKIPHKKLSRSERAKNVYEALEKEGNKKHQKPMVSIKLNAKKSSHVLDLKLKEKKVEDSKLDQIPVYKEKAIPKIKRVTVDFAKLIKRSQKERIHRKRVEEAKKKINIDDFRNELEKIVNTKAEQENYIFSKYKDLKESTTFPSELRGSAPAPNVKSKRINKKPDFQPALEDDIFYRESSEPEIKRKLKKVKRKAIPHLNKVRGENPFSIQRFLFQAVILLILISLPFPMMAYYGQVRDSSSEVIALSTKGFFALQDATGALAGSSLPEAQASLSNALEHFSNAQKIIEKDYRVLKKVASVIPVVRKEVNSGEELLNSGHSFALGNTYLVKGMSEAISATGTHMTDRVAILTEHLKAAEPYYTTALNSLKKVDASILPEQYKKQFTDMQGLYASFVDDVGDLIDMGEVVETLAGQDSFKRYLVVFQNNHELRPTGGFMGSIALVDLQKGRIVNVEVPGGGIYDWKGQLDSHIIAPTPLQLVNPRFEAHDSNWWSDFPSSAQKLQWFFEHSRGATVDGVIAVNANVLVDVLKVIGPLENSQFNVTLTPENALETLQYKVEEDYDRAENRPKAIIGVLLDQMLNQEVDSEKTIAFMKLVNESLNDKSIQVQMNDKQIQEKLASFGWTGEILRNAKNQDYLHVSVANLQGQKSDEKVQQEIIHQSEISNDGKIVNTVVIKRKHTGFLGEKFSGVPNIAYIRTYVPKGAKIIEAKGFQYPPEEAFRSPKPWYEEENKYWEVLEKEESIDEKSGTVVSTGFDKTVFGNWMIVAPGQETEAYIVYELPFKMAITEFDDKSLKGKFLKEVSTEASRYSLLFQKQSGIVSKLTSSVIFPEEWEPAWASNPEFVLASNGLRIETKLDVDKEVGIVMKKRK